MNIELPIPDYIITKSVLILISKTTFSLILYTGQAIIDEHILEFYN